MLIWSSVPGFKLIYDLSRGKKPGGKTCSPRLPLISLRSLDSCRQINFFYLTVLRLGGEQGLSRKPSQMPREYACFLEKALPTVGEDIDALTEAFVTARYSCRDVDASAPGSVKATWARIQRALKAKSKA